MEGERADETLEVAAPQRASEVTASAFTPLRLLPPSLACTEEGGVEVHTALGEFDLLDDACCA